MSNYADTIVANARMMADENASLRAQLHLTQQRSPAVRIAEEALLMHVFRDGVERIIHSFTNRALAEIAKGLGYGAAVASEDTIRKAEPVLRALVSPGLRTMSVALEDRPSRYSECMVLRVPELYLTTDITLFRR